MDTEETRQERVYVICRQCGIHVEKIKLTSHLHECPNRPKSNAILDMICAPDPNECYIGPGKWPMSYPHTKEVYDLIISLGYKPTFKLPGEDQWIDVRPRSKRSKDNDHK